MLCSKGHWMDDNMMICSQCAAIRGESAFRDLQIEFLRKVISGKSAYSLRLAKGTQKHLLMYTSCTRTFCGKELQVAPQIKYESYGEETLTKVCAGCRSELKRLVEEIQAAGNEEGTKAAAVVQKGAL
jgi:hypothetical protein